MKPVILLPLMNFFCENTDVQQPTRSSILHLSFSDSYQLFLVRDHIIDIVDPPPFVYSLHDGEGMYLDED